VITGDATEEEGKMRMVGELLQIAALISGVGFKLQYRKLLTLDICTLPVVTQSQINKK
jgi:hypothetical protein